MGFRETQWNSEQLSQENGEETKAHLAFNSYRCVCLCDSFHESNAAMGNNVPEFAVIIHAFY